MGIFTENIDEHPYTGVREVSGKVRVRTSEEAPWLDKHFDGSPDCEQVANVTRGKDYDVVMVEGFGDAEDVIIIDDAGEEQRLGEFFFVEAE